MNIIWLLASIIVILLCSNVAKNILVGYGVFLHFFSEYCLLLVQACCYCNTTTWLPRHGCGMRLVYLQSKKNWTVTTVFYLARLN